MHDPADLKIRPEKLDAIHRAILAGLLGSVGQKGDLHEYSAPRGSKFSIFPGSGLFKTKPAWLMSAELVETTKLYARTNARIRPEWIERVGAHLLKHQCTDPIWKSTTGHVLAFEKVSLYGLTIVPRRAVHYGPINPAFSREIFIQHALVEQDFKTSAPFFIHNRNLIDDIRYLESKARRHDLLAPASKRHAFFAARLPDHIHNWPLFDKWRIKAELKDPRLLYLSRSDVLVEEIANTIDWSAYPDTLRLGDLTFPLTYIFDPANSSDGVTVTISLASLNQIPSAPFQWLIPALLKEKLDSLIRSLPKSLRTNFIPVPDFARSAYVILRPALRTASSSELGLPTTPLFDALVTHLGKLSGLPIRPTDFHPETLPLHLQINFRITSDADDTVAIGRDLDQLRRQLGIQAKLSFASLPPTQWHRDQITHWDFGDLPERVEVNVNGIILNGYPALVDNTTAVSMRLFDSPDSARQSHRAGTRRLFMLQLSHEIQDLTRMSPQLERMALNYSTLSSSDQLRSEVATAIADRALFADDLSIRSQHQFINRAESGWRRLVAASSEILAIADESLAIYQDLARRLAEDFPPLLVRSVSDIRDQLEQLIPPNFLTATPHPWLVNLPRYLKAVQFRLEKLLNAGLDRDATAAREIAPLWRAYQERLHHNITQQRDDPELLQYRWMLEEYRVSLFAQELKTSMPVSAKRLEAQWSRTST